MFGLLHFGPDPRELTDLQDAPHEGREAEGDSVEVLAIAGPRPWTYNAGTKAAVTDASRAAQQAAIEAAALAEISDLAQSIATAAQWLQQIQDDATSAATQAAADESSAAAKESVTIGNVAQAQAEIRTLYTGLKRAAQRDQKTAQSVDRLATIVRRLAKVVARNLAAAPMP